jgi:hypothetical protein
MDKAVTVERNPLGLVLMLQQDMAGEAEAEEPMDF